jgi:Holliday junction resolvasome RuvABC ATP-dependent DNA helicase subunit
VIRKGLNVPVYRSAVSSVISEGMQDAIEQIDRGDYRRALRALRRVRDRARDINFNVDDPEITAMVRNLEAYLAEIAARGMNQLDRKILRSGLHHQFEPPTADDEARK